MSKAGKRLLAAANEALDIAEGRAKPAHIYIPADIDVKEIRTKLSLPQDDFASQFGFSLNQIRDWEQGRSRPIESNRAYLLIIERAPDVVRELLSQMNEVDDDTPPEAIAL